MYVGSHSFFPGMFFFLPMELMEDPMDCHWNDMFRKAFHCF